jgi:hypothetical protein
MNSDNELKAKISMKLDREIRIWGVLGGWDASRQPHQSTMWMC